MGLDAALTSFSDAQASDGETEPQTSAGWLVHFTDRDPIEVSCCPAASHAEILERYHSAVAAEPFTLTVRPPASAMTAGGEQAVRRWLAEIGETDGETIAEVIRQCQRDGDARRYYLDLARTPEGDDRHFCRDCANLTPRGRCRASEWMTDAPVRCKSFIPAGLRLHQHEDLQTVTRSCADCRHMRSPGGVTRYCSTDRPDLVVAYGDGHPLRCLPADGAASCERFAPWFQP